jgi:hypothetical protein
MTPPAPTHNTKGNTMNISQKILAGIKDPHKVALENQLRSESRKRDTLNTYARAAARTFEQTGRESCLGAQARFETAAIAAAARCHALQQQLGEK